MDAVYHDKDVKYFVNDYKMLYEIVDEHEQLRCNLCGELFFNGTRKLFPYVVDAVYSNHIYYKRDCKVVVELDNQLNSMSNWSLLKFDDVNFMKPHEFQPMMNQTNPLSSFPCVYNHFVSRGEPFYDIRTCARRIYYIGAATCGNGNTPLPSRERQHNSLGRITDMGCVSFGLVYSRETSMIMKLEAAAFIFKKFFPGLRNVLKSVMPLYGLNKESFTSLVYTFFNAVAESSKFHIARLTNEELLQNIEATKEAKKRQYEKDLAYLDKVVEAVKRRQK